MYTKNECKQFILPVRDVIDIIGGKWKLPILISLSFGSRRFGELEKAIDGITPKMLSKELRDLEMNKLVERSTVKTIPLTVEYSLTSYGKTLDEVIVALRNWGTIHRTKIFEDDKNLTHNSI